MSSEDFNDLKPMQFPALANPTRTAKINELLATTLKTSDRNGLTYASWANCVTEFLKAYPDFTFEYKTNPATGLPFWSDPTVGAFVRTSVTADGITRECILPILDSANKPQKTEAYEYTVWDSYKKQNVTRKVAALDSFAVNRALQRCLTKNLAMFGLGLYIYAGEDLPEQLSTNEQPSAPDPKPRKSRKASSPIDRYTQIRAAINNVTDLDELLALYRQHPEVDSNPEIRSMFTQRKQELLQLQVA